MAVTTQAEEFVIEKWIARMLARGVFTLALVAAVAYPLDWAVWRARVAAGGGMGQVQVDLYIVGELKGGKEDYYPQGNSVLPCSKTLYPQGGNGACWWMQRHHEVVQKY